MIFGTAVTALAVLLCLNLLVGMKMEWGDVATWASAFASAAVAITLAVVTRASADRNAMTLARVRAIGVRITFQGYRGTEVSNWKITVENRTGGDIYRLQVGNLGVRSPKGDAVLLQSGQIELSEPQDGESVLRDGADYTYTATPTNSGLVADHWPLPSVQWTAPTGHRFRSTYRRHNKVVDITPVWECMGMDKALHTNSETFRP